MYQQSVDRSGGSSKKDLLLFGLLILLFFLLGSVMLYLENTFKSMIPRYVFIGMVLVGLYLIYRLRLIGYRYTVFFKETDPIYEPRLDASGPIESPYPVGTVIFERIISAKGTILLTLNVSDIIGIERCENESAPVKKDVLNVCAGKKLDKYLISYRKGGTTAFVLFNPDAEFLAHLHEAMEAENNKDE